jgi:hypothetical protein
MARIAFWITAGRDQEKKALTGLRLAGRLRSAGQEDVRVFLYGPGLEVAVDGGEGEAALRALNGVARVQACPHNATHQGIAHELLLDRGVSLDQTVSANIIDWTEAGFQIIGV